MAKSLPVGISGVRYVQLAQEADRAPRSKPFMARSRGIYLARVASPSEGLALLTQRLASGDLPQGRFSICRHCGIWEVNLFAIGRGGRRRPWLRYFAHFCDAVGGLQEMRRVSDSLELRALFEAISVLQGCGGDEMAK